MSACTKPMVTCTVWLWLLQLSFPISLSPNFVMTILNTWPAQQQKRLGMSPSIIESIGQLGNSILKLFRFFVDALRFSWIREISYSKSRMGCWNSINLQYFNFRGLIAGIFNVATTFIGLPHPQTRDTMLLYVNNQYKQAENILVFSKTITTVQTTFVIFVQTFPAWLQIRLEI